MAEPKRRTRITDITDQIYAARGLTVKGERMFACRCGSRQIESGADGAGGYVVYCAQCKVRAPLGAETKADREWFWNSYQFSYLHADYTALSREIERLRKVEAAAISYCDEVGLRRLLQSRSGSLLAETCGRKG